MNLKKEERRGNSDLDKGENPISQRVRINLNNS